MSRRPTPRSSPGSRRPAGSCSARPTRPSSPGPTRPTTTCTAGRRTRTTSSGRRAAAAAVRRRSSPRAARRSTSAATPATASASPRTCAAIAGIKPTSGRVPRTGHWPGLRGAVRVVHPARADGPPRRGPRLCPADHRRPRRGGPARRRRRRSATRADVDVGELRVVAFSDNGIRTPTPETVVAVEAAVAAIAAAGARGRGASRPVSTRRGRMGGADPGRRVRLAPAADRGRRDAGLGLL